jgi:hypothetical protein
MAKGDPKGGRPRKELDLEQLQSLAEIQCTAEECAAVMKVSVATIDRRLKEAGYAGFDEFHKMFGQDGKASLRRLQWKAAQGGNTAMLIWLGKQWLGQSDRQEIKTDNSTDNKITLSWGSIDAQTADS